MAPERSDFAGSQACANAYPWMLLDEADPGRVSPLGHSTISHAMLSNGLGKTWVRK
jgi:hypothetical protein